MSKPVQLAPEQVAFLESLVATGRYASTNEAVREGLRLLQAGEARLASLRDAWREGVASDDYEPLDAVLDDLSAHYASRVSAEACDRSSSRGGRGST